MPHDREHDQDFDAKVVRYFAGRLPEAERAAFETWLAEDQARLDQVEHLRAVWEASAEAPAGPDAEAALAQVKERIRARQARAAAERPVLKLEPSLGGARRSWMAVMWRVAAAVVVLVGVGLLWRSAAPRDPSGAQASAMRTYATARGERATLNLPDGSTVILHNESTLEVPIDFGGSVREVRLRGEGFFEVAHDPSRPFRVHGGGAVTQVLGTKFSVRARSEEGGVRVAVAEGRVAVGAGRIDRDAPVLTAGQVARLRPGGNISIQSGVDVGRLLSWTEGRLVFDAAPVPDVLAELGRWFDRDFVLGDSALAGLRLTTVLRGQSLAEAVKVLETALDVRTKIDGRRIVLDRS